ncbi:MAG: DNA internalization-related competence protein ComEC/Rec2 [Syntrophales bacterium]|nr:DNA internalization-related competence protein ComEC/Rec2 [Syntrophales bacterium]
MQRPLIPLLIPLIVGISLGNFIHLPDLPLMVCLIMAMIASLVAMIKKWKVIIGLSLIFSLFLVGILNINLYLYQEQGQRHISNYLSPEKTTIDGIICENPEVSPHKTELVVSVVRVIKDKSTIPAEGRVLLTVRDRYPFKYGDFIRFRTRLRMPHNFNNPGGFDYERYLRYRNILVRGAISDPSGIVVLRENQGNRWKTTLERFRGKIRRLIRENSPTPAGEIIQAMTLGERKEIPEDVREKFNRTGTSHILAISGFHVGIVAFLSIYLIRLMMKSSPYLLLRFNAIKVSTFGACVPIVIYAFIAGMGISVVRATIMIVTFMVAILLGRERDLYNTLALAAFIILVVFPHSLFDISFQLSFTAVAAILFITPRLVLLIPKGKPEEKGISFSRKVFKGIFLFIMVSLSATLGTAPLIAFYFNRVSSISLLANIIVVPLLGMIALPVSMAIILTAPISPTLTTVLVKISSFLVKISVSLTDFFASLPGSSFFISTPTFTEMTAYYLLLVAMVKLTDTWKERNGESKEREPIRKRLWLGFALAVLVIFFVVDGIYLYAKDIYTDDLKVTSIDVGQGSSTLVRFPGGKKMLIDGGGFADNGFDIGKYVLAPFLRHERIKKVDTVVLTHPHPDHLGGLIYILENFAVREVWANGEVSGTDAYKDFMKIIREKKIHYRLVSEETPEEKIGNILLRILNPKHPIVGGNDRFQGFDVTNNNALVLKLTYGNCSFLLPADISEPSETRLIIEGKDIRSQVILVPHHGGFLSSTFPFLARVRPEIAIISCGADNIFRLPHSDVLKRYEMLGAKIYRTDRDGAITITTDGRRLETKVFKES